MLAIKDISDSKIIFSMYKSGWYIIRLDMFSLTSAVLSTCT